MKYRAPEKPHVTALAGKKRCPETGHPAALLGTDKLAANDPQAVQERPAKPRKQKPVKVGKDTFESRADGVYLIEPLGEGAEETTARVICVFT